MAFRGSNFGAMLTNGIQDISALLPLLGTEQCERHVGSTMKNGFMYAAAAPMSVFGSLGIAKAGFKVLLASVTIQLFSFSGAEKLKAAGFEPTGSASSQIMIGQDRECYLAEQAVTSMLQNLHVENVEKLTVTSQCSRWNLKLVFYTMLLSLCSIVPYLSLISQDKSSLPLWVRWTLPLSRTTGSALIAITIQFIIQRRTLNIVRSRLMLMIIDPFVKATSFKWDTGQPSETNFWRLERFLRFHDANIPRPYSRSAVSQKTKQVDQESSTLYGDSNGSNDILKSNTTLHAAQSGSQQVEALRQKYLKLKERNFPSDKSFRHSTQQFTIQLCLTLGISLSIGGYLGCFLLVQSVNGMQGPALWLGLEVALSLVRMVLWACNPFCDKPPGIQFSLDLEAFPPICTYNKCLEMLQEEKFLPLMEDRAFLEQITSYAGVLKRFEDSNVSLFYTLTRSETSRWKDRVLCITISDYKDRTSRILVRGLRQGTTLYHGEHKVDANTGETWVLIGRQAARDSNRYTRSSGFIAMLEQHCDSILGQLRRRDEIQDARVKITVGWTFNVSENIISVCELASRDYVGGKDDGSADPSGGERWNNDKDFLLYEELQLRKARLCAVKGQSIATYLTDVIESITRDFRGLHQLQQLYRTEIEETECQFAQEWGEKEWLQLEVSRRLEASLFNNHQAMKRIFEQRMSSVRYTERNSDLDTLQKNLWSEWSRNTRKRLIRERDQMCARADVQRNEVHKRMVEWKSTDSEECRVMAMWEGVALELGKAWKEFIDEASNESEVTPSTTKSLGGRLSINFWSLATEQRKDLRRHNLSGLVVAEDLEKRLATRRKWMVRRLTESTQELYQSLEDGLDNFLRQELVQLLRTYHNDKYLRIRRRDLEEYGVDTVAKVLEQSQATVLELGWLTLTQIKGLCQVIGKMRSLTTVSLGYTVLGKDPELAMKLADAVRANAAIMSVTSYVEKRSALLDQALERNRSKSTIGSRVFFECVSVVSSQQFLGLHLLSRSRCVISFAGPDKGAVVLRLHHGGHQRGSIDIHINGSYFFYSSSSVSIGVDSFTLRPHIHFTPNTTNTISLVLFSGLYALHDVELLYANDTEQCQVKMYPKVDFEIRQQNLRC